MALAHSPVCLQAYRLGNGARAWGIQFHAEVASAQVNAWLDGWDNDEDAVAIGLDAEGLREETLARRLERARAGNARLRARERVAPSAIPSARVARPAVTRAAELARA